MLMRSDVRFLRSTSLFWQGANDRYRGFAAPEMPQPHGPLYALRDDESIDAFGPFPPVDLPGSDLRTGHSSDARQEACAAQSRHTPEAQRRAWHRHKGQFVDVCISRNEGP